MEIKMTKGLAYKGNTYRSLAHFCRTNQLEYNDVYSHIKNGNSLEKVMDKILSVNNQRENKSSKLDTPLEIEDLLFNKKAVASFPGRNSQTTMNKPISTLATDAKAKSQERAKAEAKERVEIEGRIIAEAQAKAAAEVRAKIEEIARADAEARLEAECIASAEAEGRAIAEAEAKIIAKARAKAETEARIATEARIKAEAEAKTMADSKAKAEAEGRAKAMKILLQIAEPTNLKDNITFSDSVNKIDEARKLLIEYIESKYYFADDLYELVTTLDSYKHHREVSEEVIKKLFPPPQITYHKFIGELEDTENTFLNLINKGVDIIAISGKRTAKSDELLTIIKNDARSLAEMCDDFATVLLNKYSDDNSDDSSKEFDILLSDLKTLIESIKNYS